MGTGSRWLAPSWTVVVLAVGCSAPPSPKSAAAVDEEQVRERFSQLQQALKEKDAERLWTLLDNKSRADVSRAAEAAQNAYAKADANAKAAWEKSLNLTGAEIASLTGKGLLKSKPFLEKYEEVADGVIDRVAVERDSATVYYHEQDGDKEKLGFLRQDGEWRAWLAVPKSLTLSRP